MTAHAGRLHTRINRKVPIKYSFGEKEDVFEAVIYNSSRGGIYYEPSQAIPPESEVQIMMVNYSSTAKGPEAYRFYEAKTKWLREISAATPPSYGVGAQLLIKSREIDSPDMERISHPCEMCGQMIPCDEIITIDDCVGLCRSCYEYFQQLSEGPAKEAIKRHLVCNFI
jgi:hypothetical protein